MSYPGPPPNVAPPPDWQPPTVVRPAPPRPLPPQDHPALDAAEQDAHRLTWAIAAIAGIILLVLACILGTRLVS